MVGFLPVTSGWSVKDLSNALSNSLNLFSNSKVPNFYLPLGLEALPDFQRLGTPLCSQCPDSHCPFLSKRFRRLIPGGMIQMRKCFDARMLQKDRPTQFRSLSRRSGCTTMPGVCIKLPRDSRLSHFNGKFSYPVWVIMCPT